MAQKYVVIRTCNAGVHVGELTERRGSEADLANARRIWSWKGARTLHEMALHGVAEGSCISEPVPTITVLEVIEVIPCTDEARANLLAAKWGA